MLTQYKNIDEIKLAEKSVTGDRLDPDKSKLIKYNIDISPNVSSEINTYDSRYEIHFYSGDSWITGNHQVTPIQKIPEYRDKITNKLIKFNGQPVSIDLYNELNQLKLTSGTFRFVVNFFKNLIGDYNQQYLQIDDISPDRTELRLRAIDDRNPEFLQQITSYIQTVKHVNTTNFNTYLLNFSRNQTYMFINSVVIGDLLYVKLIEPLPDNFKLNYKCWVVEELKSSYIDTVSIVASLVKKQYKKLSNPNWQATADYNTSTDTGLKTWTDLLGSSVQTSQQIVDSYFSGSLSGMKLNIDYSDFNNFIFYSSATERLENFKYKLSLIDYYNSQSLVVAQISGSVSSTNIADFESAKTTLVSGFDDFEKFLYYESSSKLTTYDIPKESATVPTVTGSYITPVPKTNSTYPYTLYTTDSTIFETWYTNLYSYANEYDSLNYNALVYTLPEYLREDETKQDLLTFTNMLGHHYDILYTYINHMSQINKREENPKLGMPNELLYSVAKQFGWNLTDGHQYQDLWQYVLGTNEVGTPLTGSNTVGDPSVPGKNMTYAVWRRIVNNLPLLLKSKGTKRSIQALLSCYGIPNSIISINEYGGPRIERAPIYEKLNFDYALDLIANSAGTVITNYSESLNTVEVRFRTDNVITNPTMSSTMNLFSVGNNHVTLDYTSGTLGTIQINGTSSANIEIFDGGWLSAMLRTSGNILEVVAKRSKYGKIIAAVSASATSSFSYSGSITLGGTSSGASRLQGQLQELRLWSSSLDETAFNNHVKAPAAYDGNVDAYSELIYRLPLTQKINHTLTSSLSGVEPDPSNISSSFAGWSTSTPYDSIEETYYYDSISIGSATYDDNKIRIEQNELVGTLDIKTRAERSQYDRAPLDSNKLGVYFSPQTMIDEDIIAQLGFTSLDEYIGDPYETEPDSYPKLIQVAQAYWKKYETRNDINSYIKIFTLFDLSFFRQLEQLLPARASKITGIVIQPNLLERNKTNILPILQREDESYSVVLDTVSPTASGDYWSYTASIDGNILEINAIDDDQWQMYLTASVSEKYDGFPYSYQSLIYSGSTYITASTPYWLSEPLGPTITGSVLSEFSLINGTEQFVTSSIGAVYGVGSYGSASYSIPDANWIGTKSQRQDFLPRGIQNHRSAGCKMISLDFNINSTDTVDGGPVAEWNAVNENQLIYQSLNNNQGSFRLV